MEPTPEMIEAAAQRLVRWEDGCTWPDSWDALTVAAARLDAERALRSGLNAAPNLQPAVPDSCQRLANQALLVMAMLKEHGGSIVPHLLDTDENPGQNLRELAVECLKRPEPKEPNQ